jgi:ADP-ribose pyrophosphatase YjhB (NUDIX family)
MSEVRFGPGGVPEWLGPSVRFCSRCGAELRFGPVEGEDRDRLACPACGFVFYVNPRLVVTTLPITDRGEVMLIRRGIEPGYDMWAQPGGFLEIDETVRDAAIRETLEETGLEVEPETMLGLYSRVPAAIVVVAFVARITGGRPIVTRESLETRPFAADQIPWDEIAFETSLSAIGDWVRLVRPDLPLPDSASMQRDFGG